MPVEVDVAIIGAGVIGLAIAVEVAQDRKNTFVFEKNRTCGLETRSRNSDVIHAGIRPKLQGPGEAFRDFVIAHEEGRGFPGLINLVGIESPGLTAAPAIARYAAGMIKGLL